MKKNNRKFHNVCEKIISRHTCMVVDPLPLVLISAIHMVLQLCLKPIHQQEAAFLFITTGYAFSI